jgi:hypothetical protein
MSTAIILNKMSRNYSDLFSEHEANMLQDADNAISQCDLWSWLRDYTPEDDKGFMLSSHPNLERISSAMKYGGHSGSSYGWTMRQMEYIAKHGWTLFEFVRLENRRKSFAEAIKIATETTNAVNVMNKAFVNNGGTVNPLTIAEASRGVPGFEGQADAMQKFSKGQMSYAEMRSLCG